MYGESSSFYMREVVAFGITWPICVGNRRPALVYVWLWCLSRITAVNESLCTSLDWCVCWFYLNVNMTHMPATNVFWCPQNLSNNNHVILTLSDGYVQRLTTHMTSKMCTYGSQAIPTLLSTHTLKCQQFPLICDDSLWLYVSRELSTSSMSSMFLSIPTHQSLEISVCPLCNPPCHVLYYLIYSILIPDYYLRSFPSHCLAHCLSIARYNVIYLIYVTYAHFLLSHFPL
jgi:hypothetical protein